MGTAVGVLAFVVLLLASIVFHEWGHYVTARRSGIKIRQFFVGFGPTLWSVRRGLPEVVEGPDGEMVERPETEYGVKLLPLGGFVRVLGMSPFEEVPPHEASRSFKAAPAWKRAIVLVAGSTTHLITAFVVLVVIFSALGLPREEPTREVNTVLQRVADGDAPGPAYEAGIRPGEEIVAVDGRDAKDWEAIRTRIRERPGREVALTVRGRDGSLRTVVLTTAVERDEGEQVGIIGVSPTFEVVGTDRVNPIVGAGRAGKTLVDLTVGFAKATPRVFALHNLGLVPGREPSDERPLSLVGAGRIAAGLAAQGQIVMFLFFVVQINLFIGLINLLPLPPMDGGHLLVLGIEKVRGRDVDPRKLVPVMAVVTSLLIILAVSLLFQDIFSPITNPFQ